MVSSVDVSRVSACCVQFVFQLYILPFDFLDPLLFLHQSLVLLFDLTEEDSFVLVEYVVGNTVRKVAACDVHVLSG